MSARQVTRKPLPENLRKRGAFTRILWILRFGGMLTDTTVQRSLARVICYTLGKCYTVACLIIASVGFLVVTWREVGNLQEFSECLKFLLKQSRNVIKVGTVLVYKKKILNLMKTLEEGFYVQDKELSQEEFALTQKCMENARRFSYLYWCQWFLVLALESSTKDEPHEASGNNSTAEIVRELPIKLWVPFPTQDTPFYQLGLVYNVLPVLSGSWFSAVTDTLIFTFLIYVTSQFEMLGVSLKKIGEEIPPGVISQQSSKLFKIHIYYTFKYLTPN